MGRTYDEDEIDLMEIFYAVKKKLLIIIAVALLGGCLSCAYTTFLVTPIYTSTSSMLVLTKETTLSSLADLQMGTQLTNDYRVLAVSRPVLEEVIDNLGLEMSYRSLKASISINNPTDTRILEISVNHPDPEMAQRIVNELSNVASAYIGDKMEVVPPKIIEDGELPTAKTSPSMKKNIVMGILAGAVVSGGLVALLTILNDTIKSEEDIEKYLGISTLASVPDRKDYITGKKKKSSKKKKTAKKTKAKKKEGK